jgi:hypothetical protein
MALVLANRVRETTTTTGTGTVTLAGAVTGYQSFSAIGNANTTYYTISGQGTSQWEVGIGTYTASGTTLSRDTVLASSNSGSLVSFSAGTKDVFVTYPSNKSVYLDASGNASSLGTPAAFTATNVTGLPVSTGLSGLGTGVATALGVNTGSAGAFVVNGGALGTPSSGTVTNLTGTASININGTVGATTPNTGAFTTISAQAAAGAFTGLQVGSGGSTTTGLIIGNVSSGYGGIWSTAITPSTANYALRSNGPNTYVSGTTQVVLAVNDVAKATLTTSSLAFGNTVGTLDMTATANVVIDLTNTNSTVTVIKMGTDQYGSGSGLNFGMLGGGINGVAATSNFTIKVGTSVAGASTVFELSATTAKFAAIGTTASAANAYLDSGASNSLLRSTSSLEYKDALTDLTLEEAQKITFGRHAFSYASKSAADDPDRRWIGYGAEEIAPVDARFVTFGPDKEPNWVQYERFVVPHGIVLTDHEARIAKLEARLAALETA